jgi:hypothetical protein
MDDDKYNDMLRKLPLETIKQLSKSWPTLDPKNPTAATPPKQSDRVELDEENSIKLIAQVIVLLRNAGWKVEEPAN